MERNTQQKCQETPAFDGTDVQEQGRFWEVHLFSFNSRPVPFSFLMSRAAQSSESGHARWGCVLLPWMCLLATLQSRGLPLSNRSHPSPSSLEKQREALHVLPLLLVVKLMLPMFHISMRGDKFYKEVRKDV